MRRIPQCVTALSAIALSLVASAIFAQGVLIVPDSTQVIRLPRPIIRPRPPIPLPPASYAIKAIEVDAKIKNQAGSVQVSQTFENTGSRTMQVSFVFPLPQDAVVDQLTFMVDGKEISGQLLPADKARSIYEQHVRRNEDPALLEWMDWGMFKTSVFPVPPGAKREVVLRYSQLLRKSERLTDFLFPLATAKYTSKPVERLRINVVVESDSKLKNIYSPSHEVEIERKGNKFAKVGYEAKNVIPNADFRLLFDSANSKLGASVISYRPETGDDGYFLLLTSPDIERSKKEKPQPKSLVFVLDRSGSMSGAKIEQAKEALQFVLNNLREGDTFNIIAYDSVVESFRPELQRFDDKARQEALGFVEGVYAGGSTNIDGALKAALGMLQDTKRPNYVLFLTDGKPTVGERNELKIAANAKEANEVRARIISLGVGFDVNSRLIDRLTRENYGQSEYVRPEQDIEEHVARVYGRISSPVLTDIEVTFDLDESASDGKSVNRIYPREQLDVFRGDQLVLVGRYRKPGDAKVSITGSVGEKEVRYDFPAKLVKRSRDQSYAFVEKLWAMRRVGEIIDEIDLKGKNDELVQELVQLATKHGILTPYTSFLADETQTHRLAGIESQRQAAQNLFQLAEADGARGFAQRELKQQLRRAQSAAPSLDRSLGGLSGGGLSGGGGFGGAGAAPGGVGRGSSRPSAEPANAGEEAGGKLVANIRRVGSWTLYRRGENTWLASNVQDIDLTKDEDLKKIKVIKRFSTEYFTLVRANTAAENAVLANQSEGEELVIRLRGAVYRIK